MPSERTTFVDLCLAGLAGPDDIDDFVGCWHAGDGPAAAGLAEYLGFTGAEYKRWVERPGDLADILRARKGVTA